MDRSDVLELISSGYTLDEYGVSRPTETARQVFCRVRSVSMAEHFAAGQAGLQPRLQFGVLAAEYQGETVVRYDGQRYGVYRTYRADRDTLELYGEVKAGV